MNILTVEQEQRIEDLFTYHSPDAAQVVALQALRTEAKKLARVILQVVPDGPDQSAAMRKLRETVMTANAGIVLKGIF